MPKRHRITIRRVGPEWIVKCPRCGMTWPRPTFAAAVERAASHLRWNHPNNVRPYLRQP